MNASHLQIFQLRNEWRPFCSSSALIISLGTFLLGCGDESPKAEFIRSQHRQNTRVTLLTVERRNVFLGPEGARAPNVRMQVVHGLSVAYVVEPVDRKTTNEPVFFFPDVILVENGKPKPAPTAQDVPRGFNPMARRSHWFEEYKAKYFPHAEHPMVNNPSNAVVYVNEQYGVRMTERVLDLVIQAGVPGSKGQVFTFRNVPID